MSQQTGTSTSHKSPAKKGDAITIPPTPRATTVKETIPQPLATDRGDSPRSPSIPPRLVFTIPNPSTPPKKTKSRVLNAGTAKL